MITCDFTGNLGNHLFQYAITRSVAEANGYQWGFNRVPSHDYLNGKEQMDFLEIDYGTEHNAPYGKLAEGINNIWKEKYETIDTRSGDIVEYHPYQEDVFDIPDNTKLIIRCGQDARYFEKNKVRNYFKLKDSYLPFALDKNVCVINVRGGEYKGVSQLLLNRNYYFSAMKHMIKRNPNMRFTVVTDDVPYARELLGQSTGHYSIGTDYSIINQSHNIILSNSSFGIFPAWLNENDPFVIAPMHWARHNTSNGYWANSDVFTFGFNFLDKYGVLHEGI